MSKIICCNCGMTPRFVSVPEGHGVVCGCPTVKVVTSKGIPVKVSRFVPRAPELEQEAQPAPDPLLNLRLQAEQRTVLPDHDLMLWAHDEIVRLRKQLRATHRIVRSVLRRAEKTPALTAGQRGME